MNHTAIFRFLIETEYYTDLVLIHFFSDYQELNLKKN